MGFSAPTSRLKDAYIWRILLIEDDEDDFIIVRGMLANAQQGKFTLEWAPTYEEGRKNLLEDNTYDAVLVDYYMGGRNGTELIREVTAQGYPAPILLLTGRGTYEIDVEAMESGAEDYLSKGEINAILLERSIRYAIERKKNEIALSESEAKFARAFQSSPTGITITRVADGLIIDANMAFLRMVGYERDEVLGRTSVELGLHQSAETRAEVLRLIREHGGVRNREIQVRSKSDQNLQLLYSAEIVDIGGQPSLLTTFLDITEIRRLEAERIEAAAEMEIQRRLLTQRELERQGIARELHDGPIQTLASTTFYLQLIKESYSDPRLEEVVNQIGANVRQTIRELREMLNDLRPPALMHFGLSKVIQMYNADFKERHPELEITLEIDDHGPRLPDQTGLALFRIYQEALNNIVRHAGADRVRVVFTLRDGRFNLELRDNGRGFSSANDLSLLTSEGHFGLAGMKERAEAVGGELVVNSAPGKGTVIQVRGPAQVKSAA